MMAPSGHKRHASPGDKPSLSMVSADCLHAAAFGPIFHRQNRELGNFIIIRSHDPMSRDSSPCAANVVVTRMRIPPLMQGTMAFWRPQQNLRASGEFAACAWGKSEISPISGSTIAAVADQSGRSGKGSAWPFGRGTHAREMQKPANLF
jgi:hypothetical protein